MVRPPERFETPRLVLRLPRVADAPAAFAAFASDPQVTRYLAWRTYTQVKPYAQFLQGAVDVWAAGQGHFAWMTCLRGADSPVGSIGCEIRGERIIFGYALARSLWGQGLMAEALAALVDWALAEPTIYRAWAYCDLENPASARVMEKAGMAREGILRRWHVCPNIGPEPRDCFVCAKVK